MPTLACGCPDQASQLTQHIGLAGQHAFLFPPPRTCGVRFCFRGRCNVCVAGHGKAVATLDVDSAGVRVLSGSRDYGLHIYDFNGMKSDMKGFRTLQPQEGYPVLALSWSPTGGWVRSGEYWRGNAEGHGSVS